LSVAAGAPVSAVLTQVGSVHAAQIEALQGEVIDDLPLTIDSYGPPDPAQLRCDTEVRVDETLVSHLLKSNCPVTGQPDWASVQITYKGPRIDRAGLLRYLVSFRAHADFHEACVERIFLDLMQACAPARLSVYARYTRRGGLDINPFRTTPGGAMPGNPRTARQ
ncbi:MAG: NADPH-dependent 7-cyano-7-deazaguanine reductase QueF, partial [Arenimonas sp.]